MFSTTTIALSTSMPRARISENSTTMFIEKPTSRMMLNDSSMESGMASPTKGAVRTPSTKSSTTRTRIRPEMMLFSRLLTMPRISSDWSEVVLTTVPGGKFRDSSSITARTASAVSMMFSPLRFTTASDMTGLPSSRAKLSRSLNPKSTVATSRT